MTTTEAITDLLALPASDTTLLVRVNPAALSNETLQALREATSRHGDSAGDTLRAWLRELVFREFGRRLSDDAEQLEPEAWLLPWHRFHDDDLRGALAASYSWLGLQLNDEAREVFDHIHRAVVCVVCCRLHELHVAIDNSRRS